MFICQSWLNEMISKLNWFVNENKQECALADHDLSYHEHLKWPGQCGFHLLCMILKRILNSIVINCWITHSFFGSVALLDRYRSRYYNRGCASMYNYSTTMLLWSGFRKKLAMNLSGPYLNKTRLTPGRSRFLRINDDIFIYLAWPYYLLQPMTSQDFWDIQALLYVVPTFFSCVLFQT